MAHGGGNAVADADVVGLTLRDRFSAAGPHDPVLVAVVVMAVEVGGFRIGHGVAPVGGGGAGLDREETGATRLLSPGTAQAYRNEVFADLAHGEARRSVGQIEIAAGAGVDLDAVDGDP